MTEDEIKEFNEFISASPIRSEFIHILNHVKNLSRGRLMYKVEEFESEDKKPSCIKIYISTEKYQGYDKIIGRVGVDAFDKDKISYEIWWSDECYTLCNGVIQMQNWLTYLIQDKPFSFYGFHDLIRASREFRNVTTLIPIIGDEE